MDSRSETLGEKSDVDRSISSTPQPSVNHATKEWMDDKNDVELENGSVPAATQVDDSGQYPDATRLAFIIIALLLAIFLVRRPSSCLTSHFVRQFFDRSMMF